MLRAVVVAAARGGLRENNRRHLHRSAGVRAQHPLRFDQDYHFQFALNGRTDQLPAAFTWREYFTDHVCLDPDDHVDVRKWLRDEGAFYFDRDNLRYAYRHLHFLDDQVHDRIWENYLEGPYAVHDSPEARALHYLDALPLSNGTGAGDPLGDLKFYYGTMPGADWHFVNAEGREVLTAVQHRLRELGESTEIVIVK